MLLDFALPEHDRKLIPEGRLSGQMPWVIAIMLFLTLLVAAAGVTLADAARKGGADLASQVTVQIIEPDPAARASQKAAIAKALRGVPGITSVKPVADSEVRGLLEPWLGSGVIDADIPVPALVDIRFGKVPDGRGLTALQRRLASVAPNIRLDSHSSWMAPFFDLMSALVWLAVGVLLLLLVATSAAARLFQRRVALDALLGGIVGFGAATAVIIALGGRFSAVEPGLLAGAVFPWYGWVLLAIIPLAVMGLAMLMARWTVVSALKKML
jgi:cell division transport system permease protein